VSAVSVRALKYAVLGLLTLASPASASEGRTAPQVTIYLYDDAGLSEQVLAQAEEEATRIFRRAAIDTLWVGCKLLKPAPHGDPKCQAAKAPFHLVLRIVPWSSKREHVFGIAFLSAEGQGIYSDVFYESAEKLHKQWHASLSRVLGHVMAHEIGHLLLGTNAHSSMGIMRPNWQIQELRSLQMGRLLFTSEQARSMGTKLSHEREVYSASD
jgi:hypothetical protein